MAQAISRSTSFLMWLLGLCLAFLFGVDKTSARDCVMMRYGMRPRPVVVEPVRPEPVKPVVPTLVKPVKKTDSVAQRVRRLWNKAIGPGATKADRQALLTVLLQMGNPGRILLQREVDDINVSIFYLERALRKRGTDAAIEKQLTALQRGLAFVEGLLKEVSQGR